MAITPSEAADILGQIRQNRWNWLKVKRFVPEAHTTLEDRYVAFEKHHAAETGRMIEAITGLCETIASLSNSSAR
jgi:hypothetical protein